MKKCFGILICFLCAMNWATADSIPRHLLVPLPDHQVSFQIDGIEQTRWHFGPQYPRPFFYPFNGPSGSALTRMGHPGAPNHDHHRSIWFAHQNVNGIDFWSDQTEARIVQSMWLAYEDGDKEAIMASLLQWIDADGGAVMEQELVAALMELPENEQALEVQITLRPPDHLEKVELGRTNFGFLAVRVAKSISEYFGGGVLSSSEGGTGEKAIFGKRARWMDYSGPVAAGKGGERSTIIEGITYYDHPSNPRYPTFWHVREDGWMGASFGMESAYTILKDNPLVLRYLLHAHSGPYDPEKAARISEEFSNRPGFRVSKRTLPHGQFDVGRFPEPLEESEQNYE
jgi:hypothetical protein